MGRLLAQEATARAATRRVLCALPQWACRPLCGWPSPASGASRRSSAQRSSPLHRGWLPRDLHTAHSYLPSSSAGCDASIANRKPANVPACVATAICLMPPFWLAMCQHNNGLGHASRGAEASANAGDAHSQLSSSQLLERGGARSVADWDVSGQDLKA